MSRNLSKQRILDCAARLFAEKGFTETTIREIAEVVELNVASLYYYFPSKNAILEHMMEDYSEINIYRFDEQQIAVILRERPTTDGILACMQTVFPPERAEYSLKVLNVLFQEQLRNPFVRDYVCKHLILRTEQKVKIIIETLKTLGIVRQETDPDYWAKTIACVAYTFAIRMMLGIGDNQPDFKGGGMLEMYRSTFDLMLKESGAGELASGGMDSERDRG